MALRVSPDGRLLASGDDAGVVRFTDLRTWKPSGAPVQLPQPVAPQAMRFSPDGRTLAVGTRQGNGAELYLVDVARAASRRIGSWRGLGEPGPHPTTSLAYAPDGRRLAVSLATMSPTTSSQPVAERLLLVRRPQRTSASGSAATRSSPGQMGGARRLPVATAR